MRTVHSGVLLPPPLLYAGAFLLALLLNRAWPLPILDHPAIRWAGVALLLVGIGLNLWGALSMLKARTPINPYRPASVVVSSGAFGFSRNPLYVGIDLIFLGLSLALDNLWGILALLPVLVVMHYGVILREERYLEARFGAPYRQYRAAVRRYLSLILLISVACSSGPGSRDGEATQAAVEAIEADMWNSLPAP